MQSKQPLEIKEICLDYNIIQLALNEAPAEIARDLFLHFENKGLSAINEFIRRNMGLYTDDEVILLTTQLLNYGARVAEVNTFLRKSTLDKYLLLHLENKLGFLEELRRSCKLVNTNKVDVTKEVLPILLRELATMPEPIKAILQNSVLPHFTGVKNKTEAVLFNFVKPILMLEVNELESPQDILENTCKVELLVNHRKARYVIQKIFGLVELDESLESSLDSTCVATAVDSDSDEESPRGVLRQPDNARSKECFLRLITNITTKLAEYEKKLEEKIDKSFTASIVYKSFHKSPPAATQIKEFKDSGFCEEISEYYLSGKVCGIAMCRGFVSFFEKSLQQIPERRSLASGDGYFKARELFSELLEISKIALDNLIAINEEQQSIDRSVTVTTEL